MNIMRNFFDPNPHPHPWQPLVEGPSIFFSSKNVLLPPCMRFADHFEVCTLGLNFFFAPAGPPAGPLQPPPPPPVPPGSLKVLAHGWVPMFKPAAPPFDQTICLTAVFAESE